MGNKFILYGGISVLVVMCGLAFPLAYYYSKLPSEDSIKPGISLTQLMSGFGKEFSSSVNGDEMPEAMLCLSCLPHASSSKACTENMSSFIAKNLTSASGGMLFWHMSNAYLAKAIAMKYETSAMRSIYFGMLANIFAEKNLSSLCQAKFGKSCGQLEASELQTLQRAFSSGQMPPSSAPADGAFAACFSK